MTTPEVVPGHLVTPAEERLAELAATIAHEFEQARDAAHQMVLHAIRCGEALLAAKELVPPMQWTAWLDTNVPHGVRRSMSRNYMRLASLKDHVDPDLSITSNIQLLRGLRTRSQGTPRHPPEAKAEALRLHATGNFTNAEIAQMVGTTQETIRCWADPAYARRKAAKSNARRQERIELARADRKGIPVEALRNDRAFRYGEPGRAAVGAAVRRLAQVQGATATREAALDLAAIAEAWAGALGCTETTPHLEIVEAA